MGFYPTYARRRRVEVGPRCLSLANLRSCCDLVVAGLGCLFPLERGRQGLGVCFSDFLVMEVEAASSADFKCTFAINFLWTWFVAEEVSASRAARRDAHIGVCSSLLLSSFALVVSGWH